MGQTNDEHKNLLVLGIFYIKNTNRNINILPWKKIVYAFYYRGNYK